jgi:RHS repeat-associated protein
MALPSGLRGLADGYGPDTGGTGRRRARLLAGRRVLAGVMAPVMSASAWALPVVVTASTVAGVAAAAVAKAPAAHAQTSPSVAVVLVNGETTAPETAVLEAAGYTVTQVTPATLAAMTESTFDSYAAIVIGDSSTSSSCSATAPSTSSLGSQWEGWVTGNVAVLGTAPARPGTSGADALITDAVGYAAQQPSSGSETGLYLSLNCGYATASAGTAVSLLAGMDSIGTDGGVTVNGNLACTDTGTVNTWKADAAGTFSGFAGTDLGTGSSGFPSPSCPVEEAFDSWPAMFTPVAYDDGSDALSNFTASDGVTGQPYILLGVPPASAATNALAPSADGEVPAGTTTGGAVNPAAAGVSQAAAGDPVNTENGDFTQSDTDFSLPTFGPSLSFSRTYDADVAEQQTQAGTPGPLGYGWTDNWASSAAADKPAPGDLYTIDGLATDDGFGGPATSAAIAGPSAVVSSGGNTYIADAAANQVIEIAGSTGTQWGISMTAGDAYVIMGSGNGASGLPPSGTPASQFSLRDPSGIAVDNAGDVFVADTYHNVVVELAASTDPWGAGYGDIPSTATADDVYYVAGTTTKGDGSDGEAATSSDLDQPQGIFVGGNAGGNLYIADTGNNRIQMVGQVSQTKWGQSMSPYDVYTVAGSSSGKSGDSGDGGVATSALLNAPDDMGIDTDGDLIIADTGNNRIQEEAKATGAEWGNSTSFTANDIYTIAGSSAGASGVGADKEKATSSDLDAPSAVASFGTVGDVFIADTGNNRVQELSAATSTQYGQSMTDGDIYTVAGSASGTAGDSGNGGAATSALLDGPEGLWNTGATIYLADNGNNQVREVSGSSPYDVTDLAGDGYVLTDAGDGGPATGAALDNPDGVTADADGNLYVADAGNNRVQEIAASNHTQFGIAMTAGDTYTIAGSATGDLGDSPNGTPATSALLDVPTSVAVDGNGDVYIDDSDNSRVVEVAATTHAQYGISMTAGDMYTVAGSATGAAGYTGDGGPATSALLELPEGIAVDKAGDLFIADTVNSRIQEVPAATGTQYGISMTAGDIYTIAGNSSGSYGTSGDGGPGTSALMSDPFGVSVDGAGNVYVADSANNRIQELAATTHTQFGQSMKAGDIYTVAGNASGTSGDSGDAGPASSALLDDPAGVAADAVGDVYIADAENNQVREIAAANGTQWDQQMTAADIYTLAGSTTGTAGNSGTGGRAASALLDFPIDVATDPVGDVFIPDQDSESITEAVTTTSPAFPVYPVGGNITITQPGGAQITFYPQASGACTSPQVTAGGYCVQPVNQGATLTSNTSNDTYVFVPSPGADTYTYSWDGNLISEADTAGDTLTVAYDSPAPGSAVSGDSSQVCPSTATSCETITSASGRALVLGSNASGLVTTVTDPMGRQWTYAYNSSDQLTSATDPLGNVTSYTYGQGSNGTGQANDLLTITEPNAQPGGPDAGDDTVNVYNTANQVTSQTDPMGWKTTFDYCINAAAGDCLDAATGDGFVSVTDPDGNTTVYDYDQGTLAAQADWTGATGATLTSENDSVPDTTPPGNTNPAGGSLQDTSVTDGDGETTTTSYDADGSPVSSTAPDGVGSQDGTTTDTYTVALQDTSCSGTADASSTDTCNDGASPPSAVAPGGVITPPSSAPPLGVTYTLNDTDGNELYSTTGVYSPSGTYEYAQTTYQLFKGNSITLNGTDITCAYTPPSVSLPCATINADGVVTQLEYDPQGDLILSSTPDGNSGGQLATTTDTYDADGEQLTTVAPDGNVSGANSGNYTTTTTYNADGEKTAVTQGNGTGYTDTPRTTSYGYDGDGNQTTTEDARGYTTTTAYNPDDEATMVTDADGDATLTCYDGDGNTAETVPAVGVAGNSLTPASCPASYPADYNPATKAPLAPDATMYTYDADGNQIVAYTPAPAGQTGYETTSYAYDGDGNVLTTTAPPATTGGSAQVTVDTYNSAGELASETTGYGTTPSTVSYCYDPNGDTTSVVYADGNTGLTYANGTVTGQPACSTVSPWTVSATPQVNYQTVYSYDSDGDLISTTTPAPTVGGSGETTTCTYDPAGNMLTSTDPDGVTTTLTYAPTGAPTTVAYSGSSAHSVSYSYDADGNMTGMTDATGTSSYVYDPFGELTSATDGAGQTVGYTYDADGDTTGITYPLPATATWASTDTVNYGYDHADQLTSVTDFNGHQIILGNTPDGLPDSAALGSTGDTITTSYDPTDSPSLITLKNSSSTLQSFAYTDAPAGNITAEADGPGTQSAASYTYDGKGRLLSMTPAGSSTAKYYSFDASGNLTTLPTGATGTYNDPGELTSSTLSGTTTTYSYNADGERLTSAQGTTTLTTGTWNGAQQLATYDSSSADMTAATYDGNGMRASTTITPAGGTGVTQNYVWNGDNLLMDGTNAYIYDGGIAPAEQVNLSAGTITYLSTDALGSVRGTISAAGALTGTTSYDAWGNPATTGGLTSATPFGYAGAYTDPDGLLYLINRYYDPATGQFISVDPEVANTLEPYAYTAGDPVSESDPTGLFSPAAAARWADQNYGNDPHGPGGRFGDDCTDFVSRALYLGGKDPMYPAQNTWPKPVQTNDRYWWAYPWQGIVTEQGVTLWSHSWSVAHDLYVYLRVHLHCVFISTAKAQAGDIIFANWDGSSTSGISHCGIIIGMKKGVPQIAQHTPDGITNRNYWLRTGGRDVHVWILRPRKNP